ncbi:MAG TPA: hypothetical protein ENN80_08095 [Candidatus Hydrogenedentes bacterium]|nr:hypothetical protein [Candidatus Hydrogenedentota bacterium]
MRLTLIGMSGTGKSQWSARLEEAGFTHYSCDRRIAAALESELGGGGDHMFQLGEWLGFPFEAGYDEREAVYLAHEHDVVAELVDLLEHAPEATTGNVVIDTTGSVVYLEPALLERLRRCTTIVYLSVPHEHHAQLCRHYIENPRPVLWRDAFLLRSGESRDEALARCYPALLASRQRLYEELADITITTDERSIPGFAPEDLLALIRAKSGER